MDPITTAIIAALPALATEAVKSAYEGLKAVIQHKWGKDAPVSRAIIELEETPQSEGRAIVLKEQVAAAKATEDPEVAQALHQLVEQLKAAGRGGGAVSNIQFTMNGGVATGIVGTGTANVGMMSFGAPPLPSTKN